MKKTWRGLCALLLSALLIGGAAQAMPGTLTREPAVVIDGTPEIADEAAQTNSEVVLRAEIGFENNYHVTLSTPLRANIINNSDADIEGELLLQVPFGYLQAVDYTVPVSVSAGSSKQVTMNFVPNMLLEDLQVFLRSGNREIAAAKVNAASMITPEVPFVGLWSEPAGALAHWKDVKSMQHIPSMIKVNIDENTFPSNVLNMENFDALVLHHADLSKLDEAQMEALRVWLNRGGTLIVDADAAGQATLAGLSSIVEISAGGTASAPNAGAALYGLTGQSFAAQSYHIVRLQGGEALLESDGVPLISRYAVGAGNVIVSALDMSVAPFTESGGYAIWEKLPTSNGLALSDGAAIYSGYGYNYGVLEALSNIPAMDPPDIHWILLVVVVFIILAGPVNYLLLKKFDRRDWLWWTAPAMAVVFCVLIFAMGRQMKGDSPEASTITVLHDYVSGSYEADVYAGVMVPKRGNYALSSGAPGLITLSGYGYMETYYSVYPDEGDEDLPLTVLATIADGESQSVLYEDVGQWVMKDFSVKALMEATGGLESSATYQDGVVTVTVTNNTGGDLEEVFAMAPASGYADFGMMKAGESKAMELGPITNMGTHAYVTSGGVSYVVDPWQVLDSKYGSYDTNTGQQKEKSEQQAREDYTKMTFLQSCSEFQQYSGEVGVFAWTRELGQVETYANGELALNSNHWGLIIEKEPVAFGSPGALDIPAGYLMGMVMRGESDGQYSVYTSGTNLFDGHVVMGFEVPGANRYDIEELKIGADVYGQLYLQLLNVNTGVYEDYAVGRALQGAEAQRYVAQDGSVRLKVSTDLKPNSVDMMGETIQSFSIDNVTMSVKGKEKTNAASEGVN